MVSLLPAQKRRKFKKQGVGVLHRLVSRSTAVVAAGGTTSDCIFCQPSSTRKTMNDDLCPGGCDIQVQNSNLTLCCRSHGRWEGFDCPDGTCCCCLRRIGVGYCYYGLCSYFCSGLVYLCYDSCSCPELMSCEL